METIEPNIIRRTIEVGKRRALRQLTPGDLQSRVLETLRILEVLSVGDRAVSNEVARLAGQLMMDMDVASCDPNHEALESGIKAIREQIQILSKKPCASQK